MVVPLVFKFLSCELISSFIALFISTLPKWMLLENSLVPMRIVWLPWQYLQLSVYVYLSFGVTSYNDAVLHPTLFNYEIIIFSLNNLKFSCMFLLGLNRTCIGFVTPFECIICCQFWGWSLFDNWIILLLVFYLTHQLKEILTPLH